MPNPVSAVTHVISNTHWDREWLHTFQENRIKLVDCLETVMRLLETDPEYKHFHLDSQTVPLEDYVAVRPEQAERLRGHTKAGRILVGPWYTLPEMNLIEGESIVRNLLTGHRVASAWGGAMKVGYNPTSNGQVSQLPQIYAGFGIDSILYYRGVNRDAAPDQFIWESPDGTKALGLQFPDGRGIFWSHGYLPVAYDVWGGIGETWPWKWGNPGLPVRIDDENVFEATRPTAYYRPENTVKAVERMYGLMRAGAVTGEVLALEGHDQCPPYPLVPRFIAEVNKLRPNERMVHDNLPNAIACIKKAIADAKVELTVLKGEQRLTNKSGPKGFCYIHAGILSTRLYLKQENRRVENALFRWAEPVATLAWAMGAEYPKPFFDIALKMLLANHAHDDICGCSIDKVHEDMMYRNSEIRMLCNETVRRSLKHLVGNINLPGKPDGIWLTVFNSLPYARHEPVAITIDVPSVMKPAGVILRGTDGKPITCQIEAVGERGTPIMQDAITRALPVTRFTAWVDASVPAMGYQAFAVEPQTKAAKADKQRIAKGRVLENELLKAKINSNGTIDLTHKPSKRTYKGLHWFEDRGEKGNAWTNMQPESDKVISSVGAKATVEVIANGPLVAKLKVSVTVKLPLSLNADFNARVAKTAPVTISSVVMLRQGSDRLEFETEFNNDVRSHRLRAMFPSRIKTDSSLSEMPYDVVRRAIALPADAAKWVDPPAPEFPQINFCAIEDGTAGLAVINEGMTDYEAVDDKDRTIALTLVRGLYQGTVWSKEKWPDEGYQCLGRQRSRYAVKPYAGGWDQAGLSFAGLCHNVPVRCVESGVNPEGTMPRSHSFLGLNDTRLVVHAVKQTEDGKAILVRLSNPTDLELAGELRCWKPIAKARLLSLEEKPLASLKTSDASVSFAAPAKKIISLELTLVS